MSVSEKRYESRIINMTPQWDTYTPELQNWQNELLDLERVPVGDYDNWLDDLP
jgi:hypothetical protein